MKLLFNSLLFVFLFSVASAQQDPEAVKVLDAFASRASGAPSVSMEFRLLTEDQVEKTADTLKGSVILSKDRYRLDLPENIIFFNGESSWSYLPEEKEVTVTKVDKTDDSFMNRPSAIFSIHKSGYKSRLVEEKANTYIIDLYPEDIKSELIRIRLTIGKPQLDLKSLEYKRRDGVTATLNVIKYDLTKKVPAETFTFPKDKHKGVEIVDMR